MYFNAVNFLHCLDAVPVQEAITLERPMPDPLPPKIPETKLMILDEGASLQRENEQLKEDMTALKEREGKIFQENGVNDYVQELQKQLAEERAMNAKLKEENKSKKKNIAFIQCELDKVRAQNSNLMTRISQLKTQKNKKKKQEEKVSLKEKREYFKSVMKERGYSNAAIKALLRGKWKLIRNWSKKDLTVALTLKTISPKCFRYLRQLGMFPLPGQSNLLKYFQEFKLPAGYLDPVHELIKIKSKSLLPHKLKVVLVFDAVHLKNEIVFDSSEDRIVGPHKYANVVLIRFIYDDQVIPIW